MATYRVEMIHRLLLVTLMLACFLHRAALGGTGRHLSQTAESTAGTTEYRACPGLPVGWAPSCRPAAAVDDYMSFGPNRTLHFNLSLTAGGSSFGHRSYTFMQVRCWYHRNCSHNRYDLHGACCMVLFRSINQMQALGTWWF
jgi:hypothetical protein